MGKATNPTTVSGAFGIEARRLTQLGVLDATIAIDTRLFIDPFLLATSKHPEMSGDGVRMYRERFEEIIRLLGASRERGDPAWKGAFKRFDFPEVSGTCLGYGAGSTHGSAWGPLTRKRVFEVAEQIVAIGVKDPDLFQAMALFEKDIGPDLLSDMVTTIIMPALAAFNVRILAELNLAGDEFEVSGVRARFLPNPAEGGRRPLILVPTDVLRELPVARDWDEVQEAARDNEVLRDRVNKYIAEIWEAKSKRDKAKLKDQALANKQAFETLLSILKKVSAEPYDLESDPEGLIRWATQARDYAKNNPLHFKQQKLQTVDDVLGVVREIVAQFRHLIEDAGLNRELFKPDGKPKHEATAQRLFFAVAYSYCVANNVDISPEVDTGTGEIDFKFSVGFDARVLVEVKLSTNSNVLGGYRTQLEVYKKSQQTTRAIYLLIDVGRMGRKHEELLEVQENARQKGEPLSYLEMVDGTLKPSASKR
ncbi:MAG: hypothetical protein JSR36_15345 [Proteobacteria bacterium]|nr:hypothetical protein [Pseudomonadota bacterium]